ncbi:MAG: hypothetical protein WAU36_06790 [Cyclobacteriaceae bacterium]
MAKVNHRLLHGKVYHPTKQALDKYNNTLKERMNLVYLKEETGEYMKGEGGKYKYVDGDLKLPDFNDFIDALDEK